MAQLNAAIPLLYAAGVFGIVFGTVGLIYYAAAFVRLVWQRRHQRGA